MDPFQALLDPVANSTPREEQERAARNLKAAVCGSKLHWWSEASRDTWGSFLVLMVAPYSRYDLTLLDLIDERLRQDEDSPAAQELAGPMRAHQPPVAILVESDAEPRSASGNGARDLTAIALGLQPEELTSSMLARCQRYTGST